MSCAAPCVLAATDGKDFSWFRTAKNFVQLKNPSAVVPTGHTVLFYFNTAPNVCGSGYQPDTAVPQSLWFELNDMAASAISFRVNPANTLNNGPLQFPNGDTFSAVAVSTNSGAPAQEIEFVVSEVGVFIGGAITNPTYHYVLGDTIVTPAAPNTLAG